MSENVPDTIAGITRSKFLALIVWSLIVACLILVVCWAFHRDCAFLVPSWRFCGAHFVTSDLYACPWCCVSCFRWHLEKTSGLSRPNRLPKPASMALKSCQISGAPLSILSDIWSIIFELLQGLRLVKLCQNEILNVIWPSLQDLQVDEPDRARNGRLKGYSHLKKNTRNFISPKLDQTHMRRCT